MAIHSVGIIGYGHFGQFLHELAQRFFPDLQVKIFSRRFEPDDETFFSHEEVSQCDVVILCCAIREYEECIKRVVAEAAPHTILVDVATVKEHTTELFRRYADGRKFISTHPMFGPESYKKHNGKTDGFRIVVTDYVLSNDDVVLLKNVFASLGFIIIEMTAEEHDQRLAESLFLTHYVAQSINRAGFARTQIDTLSFQFLMDAVESVIDDTALFKDVYHYNRYCRSAVNRLHAAQEAIFEELSQQS